MRSRRRCGWRCCATGSAGPRNTRGASPPPRSASRAARRGRTAGLHPAGRAGPGVGRPRTRRRGVLTPQPMHVERMVDTTSVEVALQYNDGFAENVLAFANNIHTVDGGTHVTGFRAALTGSLHHWARQAGPPSEKDANLSGEDGRG